jgi:iron complex outermembrane receptor protein
MPEGKKDDSIQKAMFVKAKIRPLEFVEIGIQKESSDTLSKYSGAISESAFLNSPSKMGNWSKEYRYQDRNGMSLGYDNGHFASTINIFNEQIKSRSNSATWGWGSEYKNKGFEYSAEYSSEIFKISGGINGFYGERIGDTDTISKNNVGAYLKPSFAFGAHTLSLGLGAEKIAYSYIPNSGAENRKANSHSSQELGYNYAVSKNVNLFASYNNAYLAPDIDRFFDFGGTFNGLIDTEESKTYTIGGGYYTGINKLKFSLFYVKLKNEIYYNPATWTNTNLDRSSKRGIEISDKLAVSDAFSLYGAYSYVDAKIDSEGGNSNKVLPGVSKHSVSTAIFYTPTKQLSMSLSHKYKSAAYTYDDFSNSAGLRQKPYNSTDAKISYGLKNVELYASVSNIFGVKNGLYTRQTSVYPTEFNTLYICGANIKF